MVDAGVLTLLVKYQNGWIFFQGYSRVMTRPADRVRNSNTAHQLDRTGPAREVSAYSHASGRGRTRSARRDPTWLDSTREMFYPTRAQPWYCFQNTTE